MLNQGSRKRLVRTGLIAGGLMLLVTTAWAAAQVAGILYPDWSPPTKGTYKAPAAEIGKKSQERLEPNHRHVVDRGKPVEGKSITVVGEIIDLSCYLQVGKHGDKHRECGQKCVRNGQPVGLLKEDGTVYLLIDEEHDPRRDGLTAFREKAIDAMAHIVTVHGTATEVGGQKAIFVQGFVKTRSARSSVSQAVPI